jgi:D-alanyl-D-alanine dipeptidase
MFKSTLLALMLFSPLAWGEVEVFRIVPVQPVAELLPAALAASPPEESGDFREQELVDLQGLDDSIHLDIRYAGPDNFLGTAVYSQARAFLQRPAAEALLRVHQALRAQGFGLLIHDAYRPWYVSKLFWDATPSDKKEFVADPEQGSKHNRGCAVDLTLYRLDSGEPVEMPGLYDEMSPRSYATYPGGSEQQRQLRATLRAAMEAQGFFPLPEEWWHFDYRDWPSYRIANMRFEDIP